MCSICQPSPHLNCLLYDMAMAEVLYAHSLDLMEAYHMLNVGSPQGAPQCEMSVPSFPVNHSQE